MFYDQVLAIFAGMTVIDSLKFIVQFILHVAVGTIAAYVVYTLPEILKPWMRTMRKSRRGGRGRGVKVAEVQKSKGTTVDALLRAYVMSTMPKVKKMPTVPPQDDIRLNF